MPKCSKIQAFCYEINVCVPIFEVLFFHQHGKILQKHPCHRFIYIGSTFLPASCLITSSRSCHLTVFANYLHDLSQMKKKKKKDRVKETQPNSAPRKKRRVKTFYALVRQNIDFLRQLRYNFTRFSKEKLKLGVVGYKFLPCI